MVIELLTTLVGGLVGGGGSALNKWLGMKEKGQEFEHELRLLEMQMKAKQSETENELAITQEAAFAEMRNASYTHDSSTGEVSLWVRNTLRMVRPVLTLVLMLLVGAIWFTLAAERLELKEQIVTGVLFMASTALTWWFGDRAPTSKKLPWQ